MAGADTLPRGEGSDTVQFHHSATGDTIGDGEAGIDRIEASAFGVTAMVGSDPFSAAAGELRYDGNVLEGDLNGDSIADFGETIHCLPLVASDRSSDRTLEERG